MLGEEDEDPREFNWIKFAGKGLVEYANGESYDGSFNSEKMVHAGPLCRSSLPFPSPLALQPTHLRQHSLWAGGPRPWDI